MVEVSTATVAPAERGQPVVLVADDDPHIRRLVQVLLQNRGMKVIIAADGAAALAQTRTVQPAVVVLDVNMPAMSGLEVCKAIRADAQLRRMPVMLLTAQGATADKVTGFDVGADDYVQKPFEGAELAARIVALIARSRIYAADEAPPPEPAGRVVALIGAKGGAGTTTLATSLALVTAGLRSGGALIPGALLDLDVIHGHAATALGLDAKRTLPDLTVGEITLDREFLLAFGESYSPGLVVFPGARSPMEGERITPDLVQALLPACRRCFGYTFIDLPSSFGETTLSVLDDADLILLVVTPEITAIRSAIQLMAALQSLRIPPERWRIILNRPLDAGDLPTAALERTLQCSIFHALPNCGTRVLEANNRGIPLVKSQPNQPFSAAIEELALRIGHVVPVATAAGGAPTDRVARIERRLKR